MSYDLSAVQYGTPVYNAGNAKFGSGGLSGAAIRSAHASGVDDFLSSTGLDGGALTTGTVEAWVKISSSGGATKVFASHGGWWYLAVDNVGRALLEYGWGAGAYTQLTGTTTITDGNWHHVAMVLTNGAGSLYVDGTRQATSATTRNAVGMGVGGSARYFVIGTHTTNSATFFWPGSIDEVRVSRIARYTGSTYTVPTAAFTPDPDTRALYHLESSGVHTPGPYPSVVWNVAGAKVNSDVNATSTLPITVDAGDVLVALIATNMNGTDHTVAGCGAAWTRVGKDALGLLDLWVGTGPTSTGTVTATVTTSVAGGSKYLNLWHVRNSTTAAVGGADNATADTLESTAMTAGPGQIFIGSGYAESDIHSFTNATPPAAQGWVDYGNLEIITGQRFASRVRRIPTVSEVHKFQTFRAGSTAHPIVRLVLGTAATPGGVTINHREAGAWVERTAQPKARVGGAWVTANPKRWNGSAWVELT